MKQAHVEKARNRLPLGHALSPPLWIWDLSIGATSLAITAPCQIPFLLQASVYPPIQWVDETEAPLRLCPFLLGASSKACDSLGEHVGLLYGATGPRGTMCLCAVLVTH